MKKVFILTLVSVLIMTTLLLLSTSTPVSASDKRSVEIATALTELNFEFYGTDVEDMPNLYRFGKPFNLNSTVKLDTNFVTAGIIRNKNAVYTVYLDMKDEVVEYKTGLYDIIFTINDKIYLVINNKNMQLRPETAKEQVIDILKNAMFSEYEYTDTDKKFSTATLDSGDVAIEFSNVNYTIATLMKESKKQVFDDTNKEYNSIYLYADVVGDKEVDTISITAYSQGFYTIYVNGEEAGKFDLPETVESLDELTATTAKLFKKQSKQYIIIYCPVHDDNEHLNVKVYRISKYGNGKTVFAGQVITGDFAKSKDTKLVKIKSKTVNPFDNTIIEFISTYKLSKKSIIPYEQIFNTEYSFIYNGEDLQTYKKSSLKKKSYKIQTGDKVIIHKIKADSTGELNLYYVTINEDTTGAWVSLTVE